MKAVLNHIIVEPIDNEKRSKSGLILINTDQYRLPVARVVSAGPGTKLSNITVSEGDIILHLNGGIEFEHKGKWYKAIHWSDVVSKI